MKIDRCDNIGSAGEVPVCPTQSAAVKANAHPHSPSDIKHPRAVRTDIDHYKAKASTFEVTFKTYKIDGKTYGFDASSHRVTGLWATGKGKAFYFNSKGVYNAAKTKSIRALTKSGKKSKTLLAQVKKACGKPKKTETAQSCNFFDAADHEYKDYRLFYSYVTVEMTKDVTTGMFKMNGIFALLLD